MQRGSGFLRSSAEQGQSDEQSKTELRTQPVDAAASAWRTANWAKPRNETQLERKEQKVLHANCLPKRPHRTCRDLWRVYVTPSSSPKLPGSTRMSLRNT